MIISMWQTGGGFYDVFREWTGAQFERLGHQVLPLPAKGSLSQIGDLIFSMNFSPELAQLAKNCRKPYVCWVWDALVNHALLNPAWASDYAIIFQFSRSDAARLRQAGYRNVFHLPSSTDPQTLIGTEPASRAEYDIAFVANCYPQSARVFPSYKQALVQQAIPPECGLAAIEAFIEEAVSRPALNLREFFAEFVTARNPRFFEIAPIPDPRLRASPERLLDFFVNVLLYHEIDIRQRSALVKALAPLGLDLWGDPQGWNPHLAEGVTFHGVCDIRGELGAILSGSRICMNMSRTISDGANMRSFEIPACGGLQLALYSDEMAELFEEDREVVLFRTFDEARDKADYYLKHDSERKKIAEAGHSRFLRDHTLECRFDAIQEKLRALGM